MKRICESITSRGNNSSNIKKSEKKQIKNSKINLININCFDCLNLKEEKQNRKYENISNFLEMPNQFNFLDLVEFNENEDHNKKDFKQINKEENLQYKYIINKVL